MKNILIFLLTGMFLTALLLSSCEKVVYPPIEKPENVSYSEEVQAIWNKNCTSSNCHGGGHSLDLRPDVSYEELMNGGYVDTINPPNSILMQKLYGSSHNDNATETEKQTILSWIEDGALDN